MRPEDIRVLLVDDMPSIRIWQQNQLKSLGYTNIFLAENGLHALEILDEQWDKSEKIDLIFSDWHMPGVDGLDLLKKIRTSEKYKNIPFIMVSSEGEAPKILEAIGAGVTNYIKKPFPPEMLANKIEALFGEKEEGAE